jgi:hypothetical protein
MISTPPIGSHLPPISPERRADPVHAVFGTPAKGAEFVAKVVEKEAERIQSLDQAAIEIHAERAKQLQTYTPHGTMSAMMHPSGILRATA